MMSVVRLMSRLARFHPRDAFEVLLAGVEALHGVEHARGAALHGQVHVVAKGRYGVDGVHDVAAEVARVRSGEAHAADAWNFADRGQQFGERLLPCRILVGIHVLAEQLNFGVAEIGHLAGFGEHGVGCAAALFAAREGHHAVGAELVAAFDDGDVAAVRVGARGEFGFEALVGLAVVEAGDVAVPCFNLHQHLRQVAVGRRAADHRDVRGALEDLLAFLLRHAAEHAEDFALLLIVSCSRARRWKTFCSGLIADGAGVVEDEVGFLDGSNLAVALEISVPMTFSESWTFIWHPKVSR